MISVRTVDQRQEALDVANHIRTFRAQAKREIRALNGHGHAHVADLILAPPPEMETMKVEALLRTPRKTGEVAVCRMLRAADISPSRTLSGLTPRQRDVLVSEIRARGERFA